MNREKTQRYSKMYNILVFHYFVNVNIKWLCYCNENPKKEGFRIHIFMKMMNGLLSSKKWWKKYDFLSCKCTFQWFVWVRSIIFVLS